MSKLPADLPAPISDILANPHDVQRGYLARELVLCTLPHTDPGDVRAWQRRNGDLTLTIQPGYDARANESLGYPHGSIPRLLLFWITSEAIRQGRKIKLGDSLNEFLRLVGYNPKTGGGKRGDAKRIRDQMMRLFRCRISFDYTGDATERTAWLDMEVAPQGEFWWDFKQPDQVSIFESHIVLGELFYQAITTAPVPIDFRALVALKRSPFALDLYAWATYRVWSLQQAKRTSAEIPLHLLREQFGAQYKRADHFKEALDASLAAVKDVFPAFDYELRRQHLLIKAGRVPIAAEAPDKEYRRIAKTKSDKVTALTHAWFAKTYPGYDGRTALKEFYAWIAEREIDPKDVDALFKTFAAKWVSGKL